MTEKRKRGVDKAKTYAILLRGVTPSGRNRVPMAELRTALADAGLGAVRTYIQSGNVIARSELSRTAVESLVHEVIRREIGADLAVMARTHRQLTRVLKRNPFDEEAAARSYFSFLAATPKPALVEALRQRDLSPDEVHVDGATIYTLYATKHSDSRVNNNFFERQLGVAATTRNFNTLNKLIELSA